MTEKYNRIIWIFGDGHGIGSPKKSPQVGVRIGIREWEFNQEVVQMIIDKSVKHKMETWHLTPGDRDIPLKERRNKLHDFVNANKAPGTKLIFQSIHANADGRGKWTDAKGAVFFHHPKCEESKALVELSAKFYENFAGIMPRKHHIKSANFAVLRYAYQCGIIAGLDECGFMTNRQDAAYLATHHGREEIAEAKIAMMMEYENARL